MKRHVDVVLAEGAERHINFPFRWVCKRLRPVRPRSHDSTHRLTLCRYIFVILYIHILVVLDISIYIHTYIFCEYGTEISWSEPISISPQTLSQKRLAQKVCFSFTPVIIYGNYFNVYSYIIQTYLSWLYNKVKIYNIVSRIIKIKD